MRVQPKPLRDYPLLLRPFFWNQRRKYGAVLDPALVWGRSPRLFVAVAFLYGMIDRKGSPISPTLRSLVTVRVSQLNGCRFCVDINSATSLKRGVREEKVSELHRWRDSNHFDEVERLALDYAERVTLAPQDIDDAWFEQLRERFDDDAIVELTGMIAFQNLSSKFNSALRVPPQGFMHPAPCPCNWP